MKIMVAADVISKGLDPKVPHSRIGYDGLLVPFSPKTEAPLQDATPSPLPLALFTLPELVETKDVETVELVEPTVEVKELVYLKEPITVPVEKKIPRTYKPRMGKV